MARNLTKYSDQFLNHFFKYLAYFGQGVKRGDIVNTSTSHCYPQILRDLKTRRECVKNGYQCTKNAKFLTNNQLMQELTIMNHIFLRKKKVFPFKKGFLYIYWMNAPLTFS